MTGTCSSIGVASRWIQATNVVVCCMRGGKEGEKGKERQHVGDFDPNLCVQLVLQIIGLVEFQF